MRFDYQYCIVLYFVFASVRITVLGPSLPYPVLYFVLACGCIMALYYWPSITNGMATILATSTTLATLCTIWNTSTVAPIEITALRIVLTAALFTEVQRLIVVVIIIFVGAILFSMDALCTAVRTTIMVILHCKDLLWAVALFSYRLLCVMPSQYCVPDI